MKRFFALTLAAVIATLLAACGGGGSSASSPSNVNVVAGDTTATIAWDMQSGVTYWVWRTVGTFIDISGCGALCTTLVGVSSPTVITGLTNGTTYAFSINGRTNGGPGGTGSPSVSATPRLAGGLDSQGKSTWSAPGAPLGVQDLHGVAYGVPSSNTLTQNLANSVGSGVFVAVGANGALFSATVSNVDGSLSWAASNDAATSASLNAVIYNNGKFLAVGNGGTILFSTDGVTWTAENSGTTNDLYAVANSGTGFIAVGANGITLTSPDGASWGQVELPTTNALYGITYGNGLYVAVGASGTLYYSSNGTTWQPGQASSLPPDLKSVAYGAPQLIYSSAYTTQTPPPAATFVAVGANGAIFTSSDGINWTAQVPVLSTATTTLNAVTYGHQFVAVGDGGSMISSIDGLTWSSVQGYTASQPSLYAVIPASYVGGPYANQYVYSAMGANGTNMLAK